ncbi:MAG: DUF126 domain-containing protein [Deltaproteobacteria bacterium]|nr:DUF126 domain-containing protein [Deltaproteobacteria bacterium]
MNQSVIHGKKIFGHNISGDILYSENSLSFYGGINPETGTVVQKSHPLEGKSVAGKILVIPFASGSTVGNWSLYRLAKRGLAPAAVIMSKTDNVTTVGCIMGNITLFACNNISLLKYIKSLEIKENELFIDSTADKPVTEKLFSESVFVIKVGGSLITHKESSEPSFNRENAEIFASAFSQWNKKAILIHGAGSFGHSVVRQKGLKISSEVKSDTIKGWSELISLQYQLNILFTDVLRKYGINPWPVQPDSFFDFNREGKIITTGNSLLQIINRGFTPVFYGIPFNFGKKTGILSGDDIALNLAVFHGLKNIIHFTSTDGFYDPETKNPIMEINRGNWNIHKNKLHSLNYADVTGGIGGKIESLLKASDSGITGLITSGLTTEKIISALNLDSNHTWIRPENS